VIDRIVKSRRLRRWMYGIATAALGVLLVYGVIDRNGAAALGGLAAAITGLAGLNVPSTNASDDGPRHAAN